MTGSKGRSPLGDFKLARNSRERLKDKGRNAHRGHHPTPPKLRVPRSLAVLRATRPESGRAGQLSAVTALTMGTAPSSMPPTASTSAPSRRWRIDAAISAEPSASSATMRMSKKKGLVLPEASAKDSPLERIRPISAMISRNRPRRALLDNGVAGFTIVNQAQPRRTR